MKSRGSLIRIVSGATYGGAGLVVRPGITSVAELRGRTLATPQLGNTQDVALRAYLAAHGMHTTLQGGGDVTITPTDNSSIVQLFEQGQQAFEQGNWDEARRFLERMQDVNDGPSKFLLSYIEGADKPPAGFGGVVELRSK